MGRFKKASDIKVGVIGYGGAFNMGRAHLSEMKKAGMTPTAVAEIDAKRLDVAKQDFPGIETYTSVAAMLRKSDVDSAEKGRWWDICPESVSSSSFVLVLGNVDENRGRRRRTRTTDDQEGEDKWTR